jgi:hypothetical protein
VAQTNSFVWVPQAQEAVFAVQFYKITTIRVNRPDFESSFFTNEAAVERHHRKLMPLAAKPPRQASCLGHPAIFLGCQRLYRAHPFRYSVRMWDSMASQPGAFTCSASHSNDWPERYATLPSNTVSAIGPE